MHLSTELSTIMHIAVDKLFHKFGETDKLDYKFILCGVKAKNHSLIVAFFGYFCRKK